MNFVEKFVSCEDHMLLIESWKTNFESFEVADILLS